MAGSPAFAGRRTLTVSGAGAVLPHLLSRTFDPALGSRVLLSLFPARVTPEQEPARAAGVIDRLRVLREGHGLRLALVDSDRRLPAAREALLGEASHVHLDRATAARLLQVLDDGRPGDDGPLDGVLRYRANRPLTIHGVDTHERQLSLRRRWPPEVRAAGVAGGAVRLPNALAEFLLPAGRGLYRLAPWVRQRVGLA